MKGKCFIVLLLLLGACSSTRIIINPNDHWRKFTIKKFQFLSYRIEKNDFEIVKSFDFQNHEFSYGYYFFKETEQSFAKEKVKIPKDPLAINIISESHDKRVYGLEDKETFVSDEIYSRPVIYINDKNSVVVSFCEEKFFSYFKFDLNEETKKYEELPSEYNKLEVSDSLIVIKSNTDFYYYLFYVESEQIATPSLGINSKSFAPFGLIPETVCGELSETFFPTKYRF